MNLEVLTHTPTLSLVIFLVWSLLMIYFIGVSHRRIQLLTKEKEELRTKRNYYRGLYQVEERYANDLNVILQSSEERCNDLGVRLYQLERDAAKLIETHLGASLRDQAYEQLQIRRPYMMVAGKRQTPREDRKHDTSKPLLLGA